jgi:hypothetical protein
VGLIVTVIAAGDGVSCWVLFGDETTFAWMMGDPAVGVAVTGVEAEGGEAGKEVGSEVGDEGAGWGRVLVGAAGADDVAGVSAEGGLAETLAFEFTMPPTEFSSLASLGSVPVSSCLGSSPEPSTSSEPPPFAAADPLADAVADEPSEPKVTE